MGYLELALIAVSLAMDAFAVSICNGLAMRRITWKKAAVFGLYFGGFQALMPALGYLLGVQFASYIEAFDHWIAFILLLFIGGKMVVESLKKDERGTSGEPSLSPASMLPLAIATSIDALAMGVTFAVIQAPIVASVAMIGVVTFVLSMAGVLLGSKLGLKFKSRAELLGGIVLIILGSKILLEHLGILG